jgi:hypothetical protein
MTDRRETAAATIEALVNLDLTERGVIGALHAAARARFPGPLAHVAARRMLAAVPAGGVVAFLTGFPEFPWIGRGLAETDGPVGAAVLARALVKARGAIAVFPCERHFAGAIGGALRGIGLAPVPPEAPMSSVRPGDPVAVVEVVEGPVDAPAWLDRRRPSLLVAIERPGRSATGTYHSMTGTAVGHCLEDLEALFVAAGARGVLTVGIGDGGNEVGMGGLRDVVEAHVPRGAACGCGCGGGIAAQSEAGALVTAVLANLGASAVAASLALLTGRREVLPSPELEMRSLAACAAAGAVDGQHGECVESADGLDRRACAGVLEAIAALVERQLGGRRDR